MNIYIAKNVGKESYGDKEFYSNKVVALESARDMNDDFRNQYDSDQEYNNDERREECIVYPLSEYINIHCEDQEDMADLLKEIAEWCSL